MKVSIPAFCGSVVPALFAAAAISKIRTTYSTSFNGVRVQIWSAISAYLLVAIAKRRLHLPQSLGKILQIVSIASMEQRV